MKGDKPKISALSDDDDRSQGDERQLSDNGDH